MLCLAIHGRDLARYGLVTNRQHQLVMRQLIIRFVILCYCVWRGFQPIQCSVCVHSVVSRISFLFLLDVIDWLSHAETGWLCKYALVVCGLRFRAQIWSCSWEIFLSDLTQVVSLVTSDYSLSFRYIFRHFKDQTVKKLAYIIFWYRMKACMDFFACRQ